MKKFAQRTPARHEESPVAESKSAPHSTPEPIRAIHSPILQMQALHGNQYTTRTVKRALNRIQRFESPEHREVGDTKKGVQTGFMKLANWDSEFPQNREDPAKWPEEWQTYNKTLDADQQRALAKGLSYGEIVALSGDFYRSFEEMSKAPLKEVIKLVAFTHKEGTSNQQEVATGGRYLDLAAHNDQHFSRSADGRQNMQVWRKMHTDAIMLAMQNKMEQAYAMNAAADHFLTDAFSSGHMLMKRSEMMKSKASNAQSKILHDYDNTNGLIVNNPRGDGPWVAFGDTMMDDPRNAMNKKLTEEAVVLSKQDIADAGKAGQNYKIPTSFSVEPLIPKTVDDPDKIDRSNLGVAWSALSNTGPGEAGTVVAQLFSTDNQVIEYMKQTDDGALRKQPHDQHLRMIDALFSGYTSDDDVAALKRLLPLTTLSQQEKLKYINWFLDGYVSDGDMQLVQTVIHMANGSEMAAIRTQIEPRAIELGFRQRTQLRVMLSNGQ